MPVEADDQGVVLQRGGGAVVVQVAQYGAGHLGGRQEAVRGQGEREGPLAVVLPVDETVS